MIFYSCRVLSKLYVINFTFGQAVAGAHKFGLGERTKLGKGNGGIGWPRPNMEYQIDRIKIQRYPMISCYGETYIESSNRIYVLRDPPAARLIYYLWMNIKAAQHTLSQWSFSFHIHFFIFWTFNNCKLRDEWLIALKIVCMYRQFSPRI